MDRVLVAGISGAGKTTVARALEQRFGLPRYELDALHHGPGRVKRTEFEAEVAAFAAGARWVTEDQYHGVLGDLLWRRADTVVWLDLPRATVMRQVIRRSLLRAVRREVLWNGGEAGGRRGADGRASGSRRGSADVGARGAAMVPGRLGAGEIRGRRPTSCRVERAHPGTPARRAWVAHAGVRAAEAAKVDADDGVVPGQR